MEQYKALVPMETGLGWDQSTCGNVVASLPDLERSVPVKTQVSKRRLHNVALTARTR